jgi:hypothetical protein
MAKLYPSPKTIGERCVVESHHLASGRRDGIVGASARTDRDFPYHFRIALFY